ncbi:MAG: L,D-transpeptidase [Candidatus Aminicenantales bacterium]
MKRILTRHWILLFLLSLILAGCKVPPVPSEFQEAVDLEDILWRAGASLYAAEEYDGYRALLKEAKIHLGREKARFGWFRNYRPLQENLRKTLEKGRKILESIRKQKNNIENRLYAQITALRKRVLTLKEATLSINESQLIRKNLSQAEVKIKEAETLVVKEEFNLAAAGIAAADVYIRQAEEAFLLVLNRYMDRRQLEKWQTWAMDTILESKRKKSLVIIVNKLERKLTLYRGGEPIAAYEIGLGRYGLSDKLNSGDDATPEGNYKIIKKIYNSRYYKALLINYPNQEDIKNFARAKKNGLLPAQASIGGLIEIHGGGKDSLTQGCIAVENEVMDELFRLVDVGTSVTIVGALTVDNSILTDLKDF